MFMCTSKKWAMDVSTNQTIIMKLISNAAQNPLGNVLSSCGLKVE
jgi:hypothetical protein